MQVGLQIPKFTWPGAPGRIAGTLTDIAKTADDAGFASLWVMDHYFQLEPMMGKAEEPMFEGYSTLGYLAAVTQKVRLGTMVSGVTYRHPGFLIKQVTGLDVLSGGRAYFGVGAAWYEREAKGLGFPFPPLGERFERLEETLQIAQQMWSGANGPFRGRHYELAETLCRPLPLTQPHPPMLIGGMGERKTLRLVAQYADACNVFTGEGLDVVARKLDVLKRHCEDLGRDYEQIERTTLGTADLSADGVTPKTLIQMCKKLADFGVDQAIFNMPDVHTLKPLETFAREIIPEVEPF